MDLPEEMIVLILSWLPVKSLVRFTCVSKRFQSIILSDPFANLQLQATRDRKTLTPKVLYPIDCLRFESLDLETPSFGDDSSVTRFKFPLDLAAGDDVDLLGSCNGIVFLTCNEQIFYMWNPSTGFFRELPDTGVDYSDHGYMTFFGVGYLPVTDDYRVIVAYGSMVSDIQPVLCAMFSSRANAWKTFEVNERATEVEVPPPFHGTFINEALHWLLWQMEIMAFDLAQQEEHRIRKMLLPKGLDRNRPIAKYYELSAGDCLLLADCHEIDHYIDVWVMKEYDVPDSWTKLFNLNLSYPPAGWLGHNIDGLFVMETCILFRTISKDEDVYVKILHRGDDCRFYKVEGNMGHNMIRYQESLLRIERAVVYHCILLVLTINPRREDAAA